MYRELQRKDSHARYGAAGKQQKSPSEVDAFWEKATTDPQFHWKKGEHHIRSKARPKR